MAAVPDRVRLDLNSPEFQDVFFQLEAAELEQVVAASGSCASSIGPASSASVFRWEAIGHLKAPNGAKVYSIRLSQKVRAIAYRDGAFLRLVSLHPDHDSA